MEKIAIIDIGSNMARIVIVNILDGGYFNVIDELKEPVRLAQGMEADGFLRPLRIQQMVKTLTMFKNLYESHKVNHVFAYATAAVRRAKNQKTFIDEVLNGCGIKVIVLSQEEENGLVYAGVINSMDIPRGLIVDIGGGSVKVIHYNRRFMLEQETLPFGAVTLTEMFANVTDGNERAERTEEYVLSYLNKIEWLSSFEEETRMIGVGGSIRNLGKISRRFKRYPLNMTHNYPMNFDEITNIYNTFKAVDPSKPVRIKGISPQRAEILPAALSILKAFEKRTGFKDFVVSAAGMREGAMFHYAVPSTVDRCITDVLGHSIYNLLNNFHMNIDHSEHVFDLSLQLYRQLKVLHKLPRMYVKVLRVAAQLHDIGSSFQYYDHQRHSFYLILNSGLYGIPQRELIMAAMVAGMHSVVPMEIAELQQYASLLTAEDLEAIKKLGVIVRIAECFDRSMSGCITSINCDILGESVILKTESNADCSLEIQDALLAVGDFRRAFNKNLDIL